MMGEDEETGGRAGHHCGRGGRGGAGVQIILLQSRHVRRPRRVNGELRTALAVLDEVDRLLARYAVCAEANAKWHADVAHWGALRAELRGREDVRKMDEREARLGANVVLRLGMGLGDR